MNIPKVGVWYYKDCGTSELRYSVRSAVANLGLEKVIIVGDKPYWLAENEQTLFVPSKINNSERGFTTAWVPWLHLSNLLNSQVLSGDFLLFNDDFFVINKQDKWVDYYRLDSDYNAKTAAHNRLYHVRDMRAIYVQNLRDGKHYNLHLPMRCNVNNVEEAIAFWDNQINKDFGFKTYYGNKYLPKAVPIADVKYSWGGEWFSTGDEWWKFNHRLVTERFPNKCFAEK